MTYNHMSEIVILDSLDKADDDAKADLFETYDQIRDLTVSGPSMGGSGLGPISNFLIKIAQMVGGSNYLPTLGTQSLSIPGTSYFSPVQPGTGMVPGGQSSFGLGGMSQMSAFGGLGGSAAGFDPTSILASAGIGNPATTNTAIGSANASPIANAIGSAMGSATSTTATKTSAGVPSGTAGGAAADLGDLFSNSVATGAGLESSTGFGNSIVLPAAGIVSGIGGMLTSLGPLFGASGLAGLATGTVLSGFSGTLLSAFQSVSNRVLVNADTILTSRVKNIETVVKQLEAEEDVVKKMLKDSVDNDSKTLQDL